MTRTRRHIRPALQTLLGIASFASLALSTSSGAAQAPQGTFTANRFSPAAGSGNYLEVDGAAVHSHLEGSVGLTLDYAHQPLVIHSVTCTDPVAGTGCQVDGVRSELVSYSLTASLWGALTLADRLQISLVLPLTFSSGDGFMELGRGPDNVTIEGGSAVGLGDPRLGAKVRILGEESDTFRLAAAVWVALPLGDVFQEGRFIGNASASVGGHAIAQVVTNGFHLSLNVGGLWRDEQTLLSTTQGPEIYYRGAIGYEVHPDVLLFAEVSGATGLSGDYDENPLEGRLGALIDHGSFRFTLAGGAGILGGVGVPVFRVVGGFAFVPQSNVRAPVVGDDIGPELDGPDASRGCRPAGDEESPFDTRPMCESAPAPATGPAEAVPAEPEPTPDAESEGDADVSGA
ncbi:MAG: transporter [Sandaracinaceae bacterium]|nr:transporter [Sandaracinaceae bacterium]